MEIKSLSKEEVGEEGKEESAHLALNLAHELHDDHDGEDGRQDVGDDQARARDVEDRNRHRVHDEVNEADVEGGHHEVPARVRDVIFRD
jgi:hypothetical protein